ncbi:hypothetical protein ACBR40_05545 [Nonomuraea sp. AD125B]|uniref:hypothetical protein n=1 Tax=Nonomuraea sp. AD125B TaxID=3242897 RepID=UPI0035289CE1
MLATTAKQSRCENGRGGNGDQHELPSRQDVERADVPERHSPERRTILVLRDLERAPDSPRVAADTVKSRRECLRRAAFRWTRAADPSAKL